ncbi:hypothetical protein TIFTF001_053025 [Ficus carica]|uniref:Uncharacterized protein n=1 Tax=Ficus carica TaxID=3494 RepID=A0AA88JE24_FICCA|nr:hypothetical protein TIFTF001_053025 [Ficus carica]
MRIEIGLRYWVEVSGLQSGFGMGVEVRFQDGGRGRVLVSDSGQGFWKSLRMGYRTGVGVRFPIGQGSVFEPCFGVVVRVRLQDGFRYWVGFRDSNST